MEEISRRGKKYTIYINPYKITLKEIHSKTRVHLKTFKDNHSAPKVLLVVPTNGITHFLKIHLKNESKSFSSRGQVNLIINCHHSINRNFAFKKSRLIMGYKFVHHRP